MKRLSKKERNEVYKKALDLNVGYNGQDRAVQYLKTVMLKYDVKKVRAILYPEIAMFDYKINYNEISKQDAMKIRDLAFMFCIELTNHK
jgi:hypothetical protein